jgi:hypothetical protein
MNEDETVIDGPESRLSQRSEHIRGILSARKALADAAVKLQAAVATAREAGDSWAMIGAALDSTPEAAFEQFGKAERETAAANERQQAETRESARKASEIVMTNAAKGRPRRKGKRS